VTRALLFATLVFGDSIRFSDPPTAGFDTVDGSRLKSGEINWNGTQWEGDIFDDDEDMKEVRQAILTLNQAITVNNYPQVE
jgi:hypothetical protein